MKKNTINSKHACSVYGADEVFYLRREECGAECS